MRVRVRTAGALSNSFPSGKDVVEGQDLNVKGLITALIRKYGPSLEAEFMEKGEIKDGFSMLINGRNVLSLPERYETSLEDGDEVLITIVVAGG